jgi:antitoxin (DNA-binding transcriptional repressor) of toxin-antitoxin stability system
MIVQISLTEASAELVSLVEAALIGEEVVILKDNQPIIKLTLLEPSQKRSYWLARNRKFRNSLQVKGEPLSTTVIKARQGERG